MTVFVLQAYEEQVQQLQEDLSDQTWQLSSLRTALASKEASHTQVSHLDLPVPHQPLSHLRLPATDPIPSSRSFLFYLTSSVAHLQKHAITVSLCLLQPIAGLSESIPHIASTFSLVVRFSPQKDKTTCRHLKSA